MSGPNLRRWSSHGRVQDFMKHVCPTSNVKKSKGQENFVFQRLKGQKFNSYILALSENEGVKKTVEENALSIWI